jgi:hypothetical protein
MLISGLATFRVKMNPCQPCGSVKVVGQWTRRQSEACSSVLCVLRHSQRAISDFVLPGCGASSLGNLLATFREGTYCLRLRGFMELEPLEMVTRFLEMLGRQLRTVTFQKTGIPCTFPLHVELKTVLSLFTLHIEVLDSTTCFYLLIYLLTYLLAYSRE